MIHRGRYLLFAGGPEYSSRAVELVQRSNVIDMLAPLWISPSKTQKMLGNPENFKAEDFAPYKNSGINVFHMHNDNRVIAFHRWLGGLGRDVITVANLRDQTWWNYEIGFPSQGRWLEIFNSDVYDNWVNPAPAGNGGQIWAGGPPLHGLAASASVVSGCLVFEPVPTAVTARVSSVA